MNNNHMHTPGSKILPEKQSTIGILTVLGLVAVIWLGSIGARAPYVNPTLTPTPTSTPTITPTASKTQPCIAYPTFTPIPPTATSTLTPTATTDPLLENTGLIILSMSDGYYSHLFAYHPQSQPLTRLTDDPWDDRQPAISPDGSRIAFSSRRNGYWDIYILSLANGLLTRVSDTPQYDGSPTWSPDGKWLAYETYIDSNLEIVLHSLADIDQPPIRLTEDPAADYSPKWSPQGRQIAFVSTTSGDEEIWIADLDKVDDRFKNITQNETAIDTSPDWSPEGHSLAWTSHQNGIDELVIQDMTDENSSPRMIGSGKVVTWSPEGYVLGAVLQTPDQNALVAYRLLDGKLGLPPAEMPGVIYGMDWYTGALPTSIVYNLLEDESPIPPILYEKVLSVPPESELGRLNLVMLDDISAPYPFIQDSADESFKALRTEIARQTGWDLLAELENIFLPITEPPHPGLVDEWLFTGRAFALPASSLQAGWMQIVRENYGGTTYWRVYIRTRYQDGSQGEPLHSRPWNLDARYTGDLRAYEEGGSLQPTPEGYWLDITELASRYGWKPLPALTNWRNYYLAARFNQFVFSEGLDWETAMQQIYPPEAVHQPTPIPSAGAALITPTPTITVTPTELPEGPTPTFRPTWTPLPGG